MQERGGGRYRERREGKEEESECYEKNLSMVRENHNRRK
jgi:hypothetical protein